METMYGGNKVPFGLLDGILVDVHEVESGLACKCVCPSCNGALVARKGSKNTHCFAHHKPDPDCKYTPETAIHSMAKQILLEHHSIRLPKLDVSVSALGANGNRFSESETLVKEGGFKYEKVLAEQRIKDITADILLYKDNIPILIIEIYVSHAVNHIKRDKIEKLDISCIEIKLDNKITSKETLINKVLIQTDIKKWIFNKKEKAVKNTLNKSLEVKLVADRLYATQLSLEKEKEEEKKEKAVIKKRNEVRLKNRDNKQSKPKWIFCDNPACKALYESMKSPSKCPKCGCEDSMKDCRY